MKKAKNKKRINSTGIYVVMTIIKWFNMGFLVFFFLKNCIRIISWKMDEFSGKYYDLICYRKKCMHKGNSLRFSQNIKITDQIVFNFLKNMKNLFEMKLKNS